MPVVALSGFRVVRLSELHPSVEKHDDDGNDCDGCDGDESRFPRHSDNGPGIDLADQSVVFDKFRQVGDTLTAKPHGSGLGLHISRQIVEHFGGRMWVESSLGRGACFSFTLPAGARR